MKPNLDSPFRQLFSDFVAVGNADDKEVIDMRSSVGLKLQDNPIIVLESLSVPSSGLPPPLVPGIQPF